MFQNMQPITFLLVSNQMLVDNTDGGQDMVSNTEENAVAGKRFQRVAKRLQDIGGFGIVAPQVGACLRHVCLQRLESSRHIVASIAAAAACAAATSSSAAAAAAAAAAKHAAAGHAAAGHAAADL